MSFISIDFSLPAKIETQDDVDKTIVWWSTGVFAIWAITLCRYGLPAPLELFTRAWTDNLENDGVIAAASLIFSLLVFGLGRAHSRWYDAILIKWKQRHKTDLILPVLLAPFRSELTAVHQDWVKKNPDELHRHLFKPFVTGAKPVITLDIVKRFYGILAFYWITQVQEIALMSWLAIALVSGVFPPDAAKVEKLYAVTICLLLALANHFLATRARKGLRNETLAELEEILRFHTDLLRTEVVSYFAKSKIPMISVRPTTGEDDTQATPPSSIKNRRVFLASPMASFSSPQYAEDREAMIRLKAVLESAGFTVFYAGDELPLAEENQRWDDEALALRISLREIEKASLFILHYPAHLATSAIFELGYAVARNKRVALYVRDHNDLPFLVRGLAQLPQVSEFVYSTREELCDTVQKHYSLMFEKFGSNETVSTR